MKKKISYILTIIITAVMVGGGMYLWQSRNSELVSYLSDKVTEYEKEIEILERQDDYRDNKLKETGKSKETTEKNTTNDKDPLKIDLLSYIPEFNKITPSLFASSNASAEIKINSIPTGWKIFIHRDGFGDDVTRGDKYSIILEWQSDGSYKVTKNELIENINWSGRS